ncbi:2-oxo-4-hydroxy-4-carboxy-5-ureidoimidazoline decarboxylase [Nocardioides sp. GY 10127]|uniref:2-oxo-4-hydroxy-4-carboxy-5-ureidoimidazoline decarboxylase n=1 Tax=Nocardioides sp. GY 10127 TaxID=2569762 RepID=UPI0010A86FA3|nr:2-oxo-4-hydroxy-4-carboxy-5-ureidoimidazoline decarboxylase [Nocardioides sp. GY 10127]TIC81678.1 2-oxo-4-hydroxy-4-carboxy-5-ureidoimidazoline decarboxylase [Nocardioides sp. GY 10127]
MLLHDLNALSDDDARALLAPCVKIDSWAEALAAGRPWPDLHALLTAARAQAASWSDAEVEAALADHPRIGERHAGSGASAAMSRSEQAGVSQDDETAARLADGNRRYEERFDRIYLVRAAGRSAEEMLALLEERLGHDDATERAVVKQQLGEIAVLRLAALVTDDVEG